VVRVFFLVPDLQKNNCFLWICFWIHKWRKSAHFLATRALPQDTAEQVAPGRVKDTGPRTVGAVTQERFDESDAFEDERQKMATDTRTFRLFAKPAAPPVTSAT
jgi:hypothetical protein